MPTTQSLRAALLALCSGIAILVLTARVPQGLYADPSWQLKALLQRVEGRSGSINELVQPDSADISTDRAAWILWWAPGTQLATYPLVKAGLTMGRAVRVVAAVCLLLGAVGWALWFARFSLPVPLLLALATLFPWVRYASNGVFLYQAESLVFGMMPWLLLAALGVERRLRDGVTGRGVLAAALLGLALGLSYVVKYSAVLPSVGAAGFLALALLGGAWTARRRAIQGPRIAGRLIALAACAGCFALPIVVLSVLNRVHGASANPVMASAGMHFRWQHLGWAIADVPLAMADSDAMWRYILLNSNRPLTQSELPILAIGIPGGLLLLWLLRRGICQDVDRPTLLALCVGATSVAALFAIWTVSGGASYETRHVATASFTLLPVALLSGMATWRSSGRAVRWLLAAAGVLYVALPLGYGVLANVGKVVRAGGGYTPGPSGFANALMASRDLRRCLLQATAGFDPERDVWYAPEPGAALDLPGRAIIGGADLSPPEHLRQFHYRSRRPLRVRVLLPVALEGQGKAAIVRASFVGARGWQRRDLPDCNYLAWEATIAGDAEQGVLAE